MPLDKNIIQLTDVPYTISFVIRKRIQVDNLMELPKEKRPDDDLIWDGTPEELEHFLDRVLKHNESNSVDISFSDSEIER